MNLQPTLRGALIELRPLAHEDWSELLAVASDELIWEQHPERDRWREEVFRGFLREAMACGGAFAVLDAGTRRIIGSTRFRGHDPGASEVEIGWTFLARRYWGGQHNAEMKRLLLAHAFQFVQRVVFHVGAGNLRSQRAMEKLGAARVDATGRSEKGNAHPSVRFVIDRDTWSG